MYTNLLTNMTQRLGFLLFFLATLLSETLSALPEQSAQSNLVGKFESDWPFGDPRRCQEQMRASKFDIKRFEVLPGIGWDNLRNVEAGLVVAINYTECKTTDDGQLLIPDNVFTVPIKFSSVEAFAELYDHWLNTTSTTSNTINIQAGLSLSFGSVSGSFSSENEQVKAKQIEDKAITTRVQLRYARYEAKLQPYPVLSPQFKNCLLSIAANVELNRTVQARYEGQLLVRDFGTHVLTSVTAGAGLVKDDYLKSDKILSQTEDKSSILASASASFFGTFHMQASYGHKSDNKIDELYEKSMTHSYIKSHGGPVLQAANITISDWIKELEENLVPIDRAGDPLYFLVTPATLPEVPAATVAEVEKIVRQSIEIYYEMNTIRGCTKLGSPNFSFSANFDDGSCHLKLTNLTFGGIYQKCTVIGQYLTHNPCDGLETVNPKTGSMSCPPSYTAVELQSGNRNAQTEHKQRCHSCWLFWHCCNTDEYYSEASYSTYWCAATGPVAEDSGYLFGGLFTSITENPVTGTKACPTAFYPQKIFTDLNICITDDFEMGGSFSVPFGGFFSCNSGNPLAVDGVHPVGSTSAKASAPKSLKKFMEQKGGSTAWPSKCPEGYSQHMATDDLGCSIHYCVQTGALSSPALPPIKRPPFMVKPAVFVERVDNIVMFNYETQTWMKNEKALQYQSKPIAPHIGPNPGNNDAKEMSPGVAAAISVCATLGCVAIVTMAIVIRQRRKSRRFQGPYRRLTDETLEPPANYGSVGPDDAVINVAT